METNQAVFAEKQQCRKAKESESERCKKGEWSDGAIYSLLDAYEMKWNKRNRGNLRVGDWEEVSVLVSSGCEGSKPAKTSTQCKNKIEGMKKRYRLEALDSCNVNRNGCSSWPFFSRMDGLLRSPNRMMMAGIPGGLDSGGLGLGLGFSELVENGHSDQAPLRADDDGTAMLCPDDGHIQRHVPFSHLQLLQGDGDLRGRAFFPEEEEEEDDEEGEDMQEAESKHEGISQTLLQRKENSETSAHGCKPAATPLTAAAVAAADAPMATRKPCAKQKKHVHNEVAASIRTFAESILKLEHAKMEMYKDAERLRAEAEARRADLELRRTEMIMNTQLEIAKLLSCNSINDSKKKMTKKKKKKKKASKAPFKNGVPSTDAGLLQTASQQTQHVEAIPFSQSVSGNEY